MNLLVDGEAISIWGTGSVAQNLVTKLYEKVQIKCFYDNNEAKWGTQLYGIPVEKYTAQKCEKIIIASSFWVEIAKQLKKDGLSFGNDYIPYPFLFANQILYETLLDWEPDKCYEVLNNIKGDKKLLVLYGNCQTQNLGRILTLNKYFCEQFFVLEIPKIHQTTIKKNVWEHLWQNDAIWKMIDVFLYQNISPNNKWSASLASECLLKKLKKECQRIAITNIYFQGYYPQLEVSNAKDKDTGYRFAHFAYYSYSDMYLNQLLEEGKTEDEIVQLAMDEDFINKEQVMKCVQHSFDELIKREKKVDIPIADYLKKQYCEEQLFYTLNHPINKVFVEYANRICKKLKVKEYPVDESVVNMKTGVLRDTSIPIYPSVIKALGLKKYENTCSIMRDAVPVEFEAYVRMYVRQWKIFSKFGDEFGITK